jgi:catechol 2,3-dioxygenase-like lactoylglutathione lyase family enzyme
MHLGAFSVSLPVSDLARSREFYESLGFSVVGGDPDQGYQMMAQGATVIGLFSFEGMDFDAPMLTFNPGLTNDLTETDDFTDVREISRTMHDAGITPDPDCEPGSTGPAHLVVLDPDGHRILVDQFRDAP